MATSVESTFIPVRYYTALDPYNWRVDNRPLSDMTYNLGEVAKGVETALHGSKISTAALGVLLKGLSGYDTAIGLLYTTPLSLNLTFDYIILNESALVGSLHVPKVAINTEPTTFLFTQPSSGNKKLITICAKYIAPTTGVPYYDSFLPLEATQFPVGSVHFTVLEAETPLANSDTYPTAGVGEQALVNVKILDTDTHLIDSQITYLSFKQQHKAFDHATFYVPGQIRIASQQEVIDGISSDTAVTPSTLKNANYLTQTEADAEYLTESNADNRYLTLTRAVANGIDADLGVTNSLGNGVDLDTVFTVGEYYYQFSINRPEPSQRGLLKVWRDFDEEVYQIVHSRDNGLFTRFYNQGIWTPWKEYAEKATPINLAIPSPSNSSVDVTNSFVLGTGASFLWIVLNAPGGSGGWGGWSSGGEGGGGGAGGYANVSISGDLSGVLVEYYMSKNSSPNPIPPQYENGGFGSTNPPLEDCYVSLTKNGLLIFKCTVSCGGNGGNGETQTSGGGYSDGGAPGSSGSVVIYECPFEWDSGLSYHVKPSPTYTAATAGGGNANGFVGSGGITPYGAYGNINDPNPNYYSRGSNGGLHGSGIVYPGNGGMLLLRVT